MLSGYLGIQILKKNVGCPTSAAVQEIYMLQSL